MNIYRKILFGVILFSSFAFAQHDSVLAKVGPENISVNEFRERFEMTPQAYGNSVSKEAKKEDLLYSVVAEKLWALEAKNLGYDTSAVMEYSFKALENMYVRDALYRNEIANKIVINDKKINADIDKYFTNLNVLAITSKDSSEIFNLYDKLKDGLSADTISSSKNLAISQMEIKFGDMEEPYEDILYSLKVGGFTKPIKPADDWIIFFLKNKVKKSRTSVDVKNAYDKIKDDIVKRQTAGLFDAFMKKFFEDKKVSTDTHLFDRLAEKITAVLQERKGANHIADTTDVWLNAGDILSIEHQLGPDTLKMEFIHFKENPLTVEEFLRYFIFEGFYTANVSKRVVTEKLSARVRKVIEEELLSREAYRRGLENSPRVRMEINMWRDNYLAQLLKAKLMDSVAVTEAEVKKYYEEQIKSSDVPKIQVNIKEILTDSLDVAESVLKKLKKGADFGKLAALHTKRKWTIAKGGEFGFFPSTMYGEIGKKAAAMKIGEIYGPLKTPNGYSVFKLIGKKVEKAPKPQPFAKVRKKLHEELLGERRSAYIINYTVGLADKYGVHINGRMLNALQLPDLSMYAYRYMGFGGRISAVPATLPFIEWYKPWKDGKKVVP